MVHTRRQSRKAAQEATLRLQTASGQEPASVAGNPTRNPGCASTVSIVSPQKQAEQLSPLRKKVSALPQSLDLQVMKTTRPENAKDSQNMPSYPELKPGSNELHPNHFGSPNPKEKHSTGASKLKPAWFLEVNSHAQNNDQTSDADSPELPGKYPPTPTEASMDTAQNHLIKSQRSLEKKPDSPNPTIPSFQYFGKLELSPEAKKIMAENQASAKIVLAKMKSESNLCAGNLANNFGPSTSDGRKIATPKGRFSDAHDASFKKMESIANHPSSWRTFKSPVKKSMTIETKAAISASNVVPTLKPYQKSLPKAKRPTISRDEERDPDDTAMPSAKRMKRAVGDDTASLHSSGPDGKNFSPASKIAKASSNSPSRIMSPSRSNLVRSQSARIIRSPTKSKIPAVPRSTATTDLLSGLGVTATSRFGFRPPPLNKAISTPNKKKPLSTIPSTPSGSHSTIKACTPSPVKVKSILRTPHRLYSDDPEKIAAGTHFATPPKVHDSKIPQKGMPSYPKVPATAPPAPNKVIKHVGFTESVILKSLKDEAKAASVEPQPTYPDLTGFLTGSRRMTFTASSTQSSTISMSSPIRPQNHDPSQFTFRMGNEIKFGTIRPVRTSDAQSALYTPAASSSKKRKAEEALSVDILEIDLPEKENDENERPMKKAKISSKVMESFKAKNMVTQGRPSPGRSPVRKIMRPNGDLHVESAIGFKTVTTTSTVGGSKGVRGISASRLAFLAQPKRR